MSDDMSVRPGTREDLESVLALENLSFPEDRLSRRALARFLAKPERPVLVAACGASVVGFVVLSLDRRADACRLYSFAVDPACRGRGVGRELLTAAERFSRAHGLSKLRLEVRYDNAPALALYERLGFEEAGRFPGYYSDGGEALKYEKRVAA